MNTEERLTRALHDEAERVDVDVERMHAATLRPARRAARPSYRPSCCGHCWSRVGGAGAAGRLGVVILQHRLAEDRRARRAPARAGVSTTFTCPAQITVDDAGREAGRLVPAQHRRSDGTSARSGSRRPRPTSVGAPRYSYVENGDQATLRLGNADGSLASNSTFTPHREPAGASITTTKCAAARRRHPGPRARPAAARAPATRSRTRPRSMIVDPAERGPRRRPVDLRRGRAAPSTAAIWAAPCEPRVCLAGGTPNSHALAEIGRHRHPGTSAPCSSTPTPWSAASPVAGALGGLRRRRQRHVGGGAAPGRHHPSRRGGAGPGLDRSPAAAPRRARPGGEA